MAASPVSEAGTKPEWDLYISHILVWAPFGVEGSTLTWHLETTRLRHRAPFLVAHETLHEQLGFEKVGQWML